MEKPGDCSDWMHAGWAAGCRAGGRWSSFQGREHTAADVSRGRQTVTAGRHDRNSGTTVIRLKKVHN